MTIVRSVHVAALIGEPVHFATPSADCAALARARVQFTCSVVPVLSHVLGCARGKRARVRARGGS